MTRKEIEAERDRRADEQISECPNCGDLWSGGSGTRCYMDGANAMIALMLKREQVLRDAMQKSVDSFNSNYHEGLAVSIRDDLAQALEQIPPWEGE